MKKLILSLAIVLVYSLAFSQTAPSIYGLAVSTTGHFLGKITPSTGVVNNISPFSLGPNYVISLGIVNPKTNMYYYESGTNQFVGVDIATGGVISNPIITGAAFFDLPAYNCMDSTIYGIGRTTGPTAYRLAKINAATGVVTNISAASIGNSSIITPSTLDPVTKRFYYQDGSFQFVSVDLITGNVISNPAISYSSTNANLFDCFVYNCKDSTIYGLARKNSPSQMYLAKINPATGFVTLISSTNINSNGQTSGGATIDAVNDIFYFQDGNKNFIGLSLITGNIVSTAPVTNVNANSYTNFRSNTICNCGALSTAVKEVKLNAGVKVYPNPSTNTINVSLHGITDNVNAKLFDLTGKLILQNQFSSVNTFHFDLTTIAAGIYVLEVTADEETSRVKVVKE